MRHSIIIHKRLTYVPDTIHESEATPVVADNLSRKWGPACQLRKKESVMSTRVYEASQESTKTDVTYNYNNVVTQTETMPIQLPSISLPFLISILTHC